MGRSAFVCVLVFLLFLVGCAAASTDARHGQGNNGGGSGSGSAAGTNGNSNFDAGTFGNGNGGNTVMPTGEMADASFCEAGKFCKAAAPDPNNCGTLDLKADVKTIEKPGNVLLIFDRSGSMNQDWMGAPRWQTAGNAMIAALKPLQDKLTIGAVLFPSPAAQKADAGACPDPTGIACIFTGGGLGCNVNPIASPDQVTFKPGPQAITELMTGANGSPKYQPLMMGGTPTSDGIKQADAALNGATLMGTTAAIIITDGEPNCNWDQATSVATVTAWLTAKNIKTYVVGLPGGNTGNAQQVLTTLANAGSNNMEAFITPTDAMALQMKINAIVSQTVSTGFDSCTVHLSPPAMVPDKLHMVVTTKGQKQDVPHMFPGQTSPAWTISKDGKTVQILGDLCTNVKAGTYEKIGFVFGCVDLPPAPPPKGPT